MPHAFNTANVGAIESALLDADPETPITASMDLLFNLADSAGVRDRPILNYEFNRNISVNMK